jgi:hypothetical protein
MTLNNTGIRTVLVIVVLGLAGYFGVPVGTSDPPPPPPTPPTGPSPQEVAQDVADIALGTACLHL